MTDTTCSKCGAPAFDEAARQPCLVCGSTARTMSVAAKLEATSAIYVKTRSLHREGGRKVVREETVGDDFRRKTKKWNFMRRLIDWKNDWYEETFRDRDTGQILYHQAHRLTEHRGHGSAKSKASETDRP
jgi:uncharacterized Zn finger protein (UPF0148 family)